MQNFTTNKTVIPLYFWTCFFLDSDDGDYESIEPTLHFQCQSQGKFLAGSSPNSQSPGRAICILICVLIYVIGIFGVGSNIANAFVLRKSLKGASESLKRLLIVLAIFEAFASFLSIFLGTVMVAIIEDANRSKAAFYMLKIGHILYSYGRGGAIYISILVTIERYLVISFPIKSKVWLSSFKSKIYLAGVIVLAALLDLPWIFTAEVARNDYAALSPNTSLTKFPYILKSTDFFKTTYNKVKFPQLILSYIMPFPLILIFNGLLYKSIYNWNKKRKALSKNQKREINTAKMISIVVFVLLLCHAVSCVIVFATQVLKVIYRELMLLQVLAVTISAAVNFIVYYACGKAFREEFSRLARGTLTKITGGNWIPQDTPVTPTQSTRTGEDSSDVTSNEKGDRQGNGNVIAAVKAAKTVEEETKL